MATLQIEGRQIDVDDSFLKLAPDEQQATVDEIASHFAPPPDKYQQAAIDDISKNGEDAGFTRRLAHGATLGADSTILAGLQTPLEMIKRGTFNPAEGYNYAKAREDQIMNDARRNTGALGSATEMLGGGVAAGGLASGGLTAGRLLSSAPGLLGRTAATAADAAGLGGFSGAMEGNGLSERAANAGRGALTGALGGVALPIVGAIARGTVSPLISNIMARVDPEGFARRQVARGIIESGRPTADIAGDVTQAANEGQGVFNVADAMGNAGQRMLSTVARAPGEGRTAVVDALEGRQGTQGRRISGALSEGFNAPETAAQTEARLTASRGADADAAYGAVRDDAKPVDLSGAIDHIDQTLTPGVNRIATPQSGIANDSAEAALQSFRDRLTDGRSVLTDFPAVQRVRGDLSDAVQTATRAGQGNKARLLGGLLRQIDAAMETASAGHLEANRNFSQASRDIEAVQSGRDAAMRGRTEDIIPAFQNLRPEAQQAFRSGYVDPLIAQTQGAAFGANKARPLINSAFQDEAAAMAPGNPLMQRRIGREQIMAETRNQALGGSRTMDNINDHDAMGIDPTMVGHLLAGNYGSAVKSILHAGSRAVTGNTPAVREAVANILLQHGAAVTPAALERMVGETVRKIQMVQQLAAGASRVAAGAVAVAPSANRKPPIFKRKAS